MEEKQTQGQISNLKLLWLFILIMLFGLGLPLLISLWIIPLYDPTGFIWDHVPVHSFIEAAGSSIAIFFALILLVSPRIEYKGIFRVIATAFISMGMLDLFHSIYEAGNEFVWLHSSATFAGGFLLLLLYLPNKLLDRIGRKLFIIMTALTFLIGLYVIFEPFPLIRMLDDAGEFNNVARFTNYSAGVFFLLVIPKFLQLYKKYRDKTFIYLALLTAMFSSSGFIFENSTIWNVEWWWWHVLRFAAYILVLIYAMTLLRYLVGRIEESESQYRLLFEKINEGFAHAKIITDRQGKPIDWVYINVNPAFEKQTGFKDVIGKRMSDILPGAETDVIGWGRQFGRVALTGKEEYFERYAKALKKWFVVHAFSPRHGEFAATLEDITERKKNESNLKKMNEFMTGREEKMMELKKELKVARSKLTRLQNKHS